MARSGIAKDGRDNRRLLHFTAWVTVSASRIDGNVVMLPLIQVS